MRCICLKPLVFRFKKWSNKRYAVFNSLKKQVVIATLAVAYTVSINVSKAQDQQVLLPDERYEHEELEEVSVSANVLDLKVAETGRNVQVIEGAALRRLPVNSVDDVLRYLPGIESKTKGPFGTQTNFIIRGSNFNQVLMMIDGVKINDPLTSHFNSYIPVSLSEIERIEVIYGPASAEYGADAVGGVINIITKTFSEKKYDQKTSVDAKLFLGDYNLKSIQSGFFSQLNKLKVSGGIDYNSSPGQINQSGTPMYFENRTITLASAYKINDKTGFALRASNDKRDFSAQRFYTALSIDTAIEVVSRNFIQAKVFRNAGIHRTNILLSFVDTEDVFKLNKASIANENFTQLANIFLNHKIQFSKSFQLATGFQYSNRNVKSNNRGNHSFSQAGLFLSGAYQWTGLTANLTTRAAYDETYGFKFIPQLSLSYRANNFILRTSAGSAIRAADFTENYYNNYPLTTIRNPMSQIGNPYLDAEKSITYDFGIDYQLSDFIRTGATLFYRYSENMIDYAKYNSSLIRNNQNLIPDTIYLYAQNIRSLQTKGAEIYIHVNKRWTSNFVTSFNSGYTILNSENDQAVLSQYIASHAKQILNNQLDIQFYRVKWGLQFAYKVRDVAFNEALGISMESWYTMFNSNMEVDLHESKIFLTVQANNIFDTRTYDILGAELPYRWLMGGLRFQF